MYNLAGLLHSFYMHQTALKCFTFKKFYFQTKKYEWALLNPIHDPLAFLFLISSEGTQMNNVGPGSALMQAMTQYPTLGQVSHAYEQPQPGKELNKYASLKAVGKTACILQLGLSIKCMDGYFLFIHILGLLATLHLY